jgi:hypothetical protein
LAACGSVSSVDAMTLPLSRLNIALASPRGFLTTNFSFLTIKPPFGCELTSNSPAGLDGMIQRRLKAIHHEAKCIKKVALAGAISSHKNRQSPWVNVAFSDALIISNPHAPQKGFIRHNNAIPMVPFDLQFPLSL